MCRKIINKTVAVGKDIIIEIFFKFNHDKLRIRRNKQINKSKKLLIEPQKSEFHSNNLC